MSQSEVRVTPPEPTDALTSFFLSYDSLVSEACRGELSLAREASKRIAPIVWARRRGTTPAARAQRSELDLLSARGLV